MKKKIVVGVALITAIVLLLFLLFHLRQDESINPNLMTAPKEFIYPANAEAKLKRLLEDDTLKKIFIKETVNTQYPKEKWSGRLKYSSISYQALFAVGHSKIIFKLKKLTAPGLTFSIFNPKNSRLFYKIFLNHTSLYGYSRKTTPTLDRLSKNSVVFQNAYTTSS